MAGGHFAQRTLHGLPVSLEENVLVLLFWFSFLLTGTLEAAGDFPNHWIPCGWFSFWLLVSVWPISGYYRHWVVNWWKQDLAQSLSLFQINQWHIKKIQKLWLSWQAHEEIRRDSKTTDWDNFGQHKLSGNTSNQVILAFNDHYFKV